ncbi:MAG: multifunctional oxoglutarate decarboxylase/oxoglutarate dehydrogenase thiamine pyrophosphate-binding subunit/dihydrolipoyllysine-residue succinyltransferase subunit [Solirubrobacterales bacterium]|nr:multifunctional oxoglutarate decarboxylase/oxoglutarate dehydrogenase thiamine pyrophosphate-binding subunit/dihydrolipoyllysine-residue succinyltransferase subunit [Solirubrobacterales bacterium]MCB8971298.1 multifunctional oxoglutarate decarboxylase/oxoglutarate dehydrogenase thiamine pyrophosphate-binding subunit/dihydrolipoyllysine-residue succinyltransferase subunit [Thermoleophilales bacterium]
MPATGTVQIEMPAMGESVSEGIVLEWHVAEGDQISEGDTIVEVSTDKIDAEVPATVSGTVTKLLVEPDEVVKVGQALAEIEPGSGSNGAGTSSGSGDDAGDAGDGLPETGSGGEGDADLGESGGGAAAPEGDAGSSGASEGGSGEIVEVTMPEMGESVAEGTVLEWHKAAGDAIEEGETLVEVSTDKVDAEVPATASGTVTELLVEPDDVVKVGQALARIEVGAGSGASAAPSEAPTPSGNGTGAEAAEIDSDAKASPVAKRIAAAEGLDLSKVEGSGPGGKVMKADVLAAAGGGNGAAPTLSEGEAKVLRGPAGMLAKAMDESRSIPTATSFRTLAVDTLDAKRKAINGMLAEQGMKVSFTHLIAWAIVEAAREWPAMFRTFEERDGKPNVIDHGQVNLGIAVDIEKKDGSRSLMVPRVLGADQLDFKAFHAGYEDLIRKTRENSLTADDFQGTNITLTNPGGLGTIASVPRLMTGQGTIVATGSIAYPPEWKHAAPDKLNALGVSKVMTMTSTYDHRIIQGAESGSFLRRIDELLSGNDEFYEGVAESLGIDAATVTNAHPASASAPPLATGTGSHQVVSAPSVGAVDEELLQAVQAATSLLKAYRTHGHLSAHLNPLGGDGKGDPALEPENLNLTPELMKRIPASILRIGVPGETLLDALPRMRDAYCGSMGYQIEHLSSHQQRMWLREMIEAGKHRAPLDKDEKRSLLHRLIQVFQFERFLQKAYLGQKMFSIEGLDATVPMIDELATLAKKNGADQVVIGMAHRGRLSVLAHNLGRSMESIMAEFEGAKAIDAVKRTDALRHGGTGDVKYHHGAEGLFESGEGDVRMRLYPNPSHLEFVGPVVEGGARAAQTGHAGPRLNYDASQAVPLLLHGDAAFPGQGVVAENFNMQSLEGYSTGGTVHIIQDNSVGFTTDPMEGRSTPYASDMAKGFNVPIIHVNADEPEACIAAVRLAMAYREKFHRDVVIDLIGYRRYGHNETDEPAYTQPKETAAIKKHPPLSDLYAKRLIEGGVVTQSEVESDANERRDELSEILKKLRGKIERGEFEDPTVTGGTGELDRTKSPEVETKVSEKRLRTLNSELIKFPDSFTVHRKLRKPLERREEILDEGPIEYGHAEALAFASLLTEGTHIRLTGQDSERGTFSNRHLVLHDEKTGLKYAPIQNLSGALAPFEVHNSPLSENSCLGFEYGYSAASPESLILWEAQFGDFDNSAQVIIDQFIVAGESKWGQTTRLTLLLPHGYEGSGPEHSSARIERFLQLGAEGNMRLANPTTAAQYFHLLRRQARIAKPRPMVVFTPKGLLRLGEASSKLSDLTEGSFQYVLDDPRTEGRHEEIKRLILCSGRVFYDLDGHDRREDATDVAIARTELIYPFPRAQIAELIASYPNLEEIIWAQEEPQNMGPWHAMERRLPSAVGDRGIDVRYVGRPERASPSEGYPAAHRSEQERIVLTALTG